MVELILQECTTAQPDWKIMKMAHMKLINDFHNLSHPLGEDLKHVRDNVAGKWRSVSYGDCIITCTINQG